MFFVLKLITNNSILVNYFLHFFKQSFFKTWFLKFFSFLFYFFQPKKKKIFSILKSPHVNKTAQHQFKVLTIFLTIKFKTFELTSFLFFFKKVMISLFINFNKILIFLFKKKSTKFLIKNFNPIKFKTSFFVSNNINQTYLYLKLFNVFGSVLFLNN